MIDSLLNPFETWDLWVISAWYLTCLVAALAIAYAQSKFGIGDSDSKPLDGIPDAHAVLAAGFAMPILEEVIFRGLPIYLNAPGLVVILATVVWCVLHGRRAVIVAPFGLLWIKMWMGGFGVAAIAMHILHNTFLVGVYFSNGGLTDDKESEAVQEDTLRSRVEHVSIRISGERNAGP